MLKVLTRQQIRDLDAYTIMHEPISSIDLMERACMQFVSWYTQRFETSAKVNIVCGTGNNGGDGLGIARLLSTLNYDVEVSVIRGSSQETPDFKTNLEKLTVSRVVVNEITSIEKNLFTNCHILIDALFGSGLSRPVEGIYEQTILCINQIDAIRIAVDMPSGLMADEPSEGVIVSVNYTVSFELPQLVFFLPENYTHTGEWHIIPIALSKEFIENSDSSFFLLEKKDIDTIKKKRSKFDHKGTFGNALLIAGSYGKMGAAVLAAKAAMRSGLGLLTTHVPKCGYAILQTSFPESMVSVDSHENVFSEIPLIEKYDAIGIGPGIGADKETVHAFASLLKFYKRPIVIDADGLNILSENKALLKLIPEGSLLTPHTKEFERLVGVCKNSFERLEKLKQLAHQLKSYVILKGAFSAIATPEKNVFFNPTGNPGMATGGSGDVLTGILTGLIAQGYSSRDAALFGVYIHGLAGDLASNRKSKDAMIASDIIEFMSEAFKFIESQIK